MIHPEDRGYRICHFGRVTASLSHDLGNALSSALETAGLIGDWVEGAGQGRPIDPARLETAVGRIEKSLTRGLDQVQLLNWIAHSIDTKQEDPPLHIVVGRAVDSARYFARQRNVAIEIAGHPGEVAVRGRAFELHCLIFSCLGLVADGAAAGSTITVRPESGEGECIVRFDVSEALEGVRGDEEASGRVEALAATSGCRLEGAVGPEVDLVLRIPGVAGRVER